MANILLPSEKQSMVECFLSVAIGQSADVAFSCLEARRWQLEDALELFYAGSVSVTPVSSPLAISASDNASSSVVGFGGCNSIPRIASPPYGVDEFDRRPRPVDEGRLVSDILQVAAGRSSETAYEFLQMQETSEKIGSTSHLWLVDEENVRFKVQYPAEDECVSALLHRAEIIKEVPIHCIKLLYRGNSLLPQNLFHDYGISKGDDIQLIVNMERLEEPTMSLAYAIGRRYFTVAEIKLILKKILQSVFQHHKGWSWAMHQGLHPWKITLMKKGSVISIGKTTPAKIQIYYQAPEILMGFREVTEAADLWVVGCIFSEMVSILKVHMFGEKTEAAQMFRIFQVLGLPTRSVFKHMCSYARVSKIQLLLFEKLYEKMQGKTPVKSVLQSVVLSDLGVDLLRGLLAFCPDERLTAERALSHDWFKEDPKEAENLDLTFHALACREE